MRHSSSAFPETPRALHRHEVPLTPHACTLHRHEVPLTPHACSLHQHDHPVLTPGRRSSPDTIGCLSPGHYPDFGNQTAGQILARCKMKISDLAALSEELSRALHLPSTPCRTNMTTPRGTLVMTTPRGSQRPRHEALVPLRQHTGELSNEGGQEISVLKPCKVESCTAGVGDCSETTSESILKMDVAEVYQMQFAVKKGWNASSSGSSMNLDLACRSATSAMSSENLERDATDFSGGMHFSYSIRQNEKSFSRWVVSSPANLKRVAWEMCGLALVIYDLMVIPLLFIFDPPDNVVTDGMDWIERIYWTINIPVTLTTGFIEKGVLVTGLQRILLHYVKTWLLVDIFTVIPDWLFCLLSLLGDEDDESSDATFLRMLRFLRLLRFARLMRMVKLRNAWELIHDFIDSEKMGIVLEVIKNIMILMLVNHYIASLWFAIGSAQKGNSWLKEHGFTSSRADWGHQYLVAYHWSLTQFTSTMHVQPQSVPERTFAIGVVLFGLVGFSYIVGSISSSLARWGAMDEKRTKNFWLLRKFLRHKKVPHELSVRIRAYVQSRWEYGQRHMVATDIESLNLLSENLKSELYCSLHGPSLRVHPIFQELHLHSQVTTQRLMLMGVSSRQLAPLDMMFIAGEEARDMSFLTSGTMQYDRMHLEKTYPEVVESHEDWIAEPVIWISEWRHLGDLRAKTSADLLLVDPEKLLKIAQLNPLAFAMLCSYAQDYVRWLNNQEREFLSDISQGECVTRELEEIVDAISSAMSLNKMTKRNSKSSRESMKSWTSLRKSTFKRCPSLTAMEQ